jgi:hypothetical protein
VVDSGREGGAMSPTNKTRIIVILIQELGAGKWKMELMSFPSILTINHQQNDLVSSKNFP